MPVMQRLNVQMTVKDSEVKDFEAKGFKKVAEPKPVKQPTKPPVKAPPKAASMVPPDDKTKAGGATS